MRQYCIRPDSTLFECLKVIDASAAGIALAVDNNLRLIGTVSDGDIRRALLKGYSIESTIQPVINQKCFYVLQSVGRSEVLDIMQARRFKQVPVVDKENRLVGLHQLHELLGRIKRPNWAVIMAGGKGVRLRPLTENIPKPMLKVAGRPILERIIFHLISFGITKIFISVNYLSNIITNYFEDGKHFGCKIEYLREETQLGTGGALSLLPKGSNEPIFVLNGDLLTQFDVGSMLEFHKSKNVLATIALYDHTYTVPFGVMRTDESGFVEEIQEKPIVSWQVNAGIYLIEPQLIAEVPSETFFSMPELIGICLVKKKQVAAYKIEEDWIDIGRPEELKRARGNITV